MRRALFMALAFVAAGCRPNAKSGAEPADAPKVALNASSSGQRIEVPVGTFTIELTSPRTPGHRFEWGDATVTSSAVLARGKEILQPDPSIDGGIFRHVYRFQAVAPGRATITIAPANGPDLPPTFTVDVVVRGSSADAGAAPATQRPQPGGCRETTADGPCTFVAMTAAGGDDGGVFFRVRHRVVADDGQTHTFDTTKLRVAPSDEARLQAYYAAHSPVHCTIRWIDPPCPPQLSRTTLDLATPPFATVVPE